MKTNVVFYNFSEVGQNETERVVGGFNHYDSTIVADVNFIDENIEEILKQMDNIGQRYYRKVAHSNTISQSEDNLPLVYMLDKHGESYLKQGNLIDEDSLYVAGDVFDKDLVFNKGAQLEYNIRINSLDSSKATISFIKK